MNEGVPDAARTALRRIGDVRDPGAVGAWLRAIVRNTCRMRLRGTEAELPLSDAVLPPSVDMVPDRVVETHALRDWVWTAMGELSPRVCDNGRSTRSPDPVSPSGRWT